MVLIVKNDVDSSASSVDLDVNFNEKRVLDLGKQLLKGRFFIGTLLEKYHVEKLNAYRDVISIDPDENQLIEALRDLTAHITRFYPQEDWWVGITRPETTCLGLPKTYCLWVNLPQGNVLGKYWFKIRSVKFLKNELVVVVKIERKIEECVPRNPLIDQLKKEIENSRSKNYETNSELFDSLKETFEKSTEQVGKSLKYFFCNVTTPKNIKEAIIFTSLLVVACVTGLFEVIKFLSEFLIKFMYAWSHFVRASLPILQVLLNFFENIFKVLCTFVAYMIKPQSQQPTRVYATSLPPKYITYNRQTSRKGVVITELN